MTKSKRGRYTLEFKQEAARLVEPGQSQAAAARSLGVVEQTLGCLVTQFRATAVGIYRAGRQKEETQAHISRCRCRRCFDLDCDVRTLPGLPAHSKHFSVMLVTASSGDTC
jgi:transposase